VRWSSVRHGQAEGGRALSSTDLLREVELCQEYDRLREVELCQAHTS